MPDEPVSSDEASGQRRQQIDAAGRQDQDAGSLASTANIDLRSKCPASGSGEYDPPPAGSFAGYELVREIQRGGQGVVYQAIQLSTNRRVAIKVMREGPLAGAQDRARFDREVQILGHLKHPNVISIFHSGTTPDGHLFYVMDYVHGEPLDRFVRMTMPPLEATLELFAVICDAVQYAHQKGVIHRDLKPSNVIVEGNGTPRILDFGLARPLSVSVESAISVSQQLVGTLPYMSPEQASGGTDEVDTRTDVYSLGVILYRLLTGQPPYPVEGRIADVLRHISETEPTPASRNWTRDSGVTRKSARWLRAGECPIDTEVETIVAKALAKEPARRYQSVGELARDIRHYLAGEPIEARCDSLIYVIWKQSRRFLHRAPAAALVLLCAILAPGLILSLVFWRQAVRERDVAEAAIGFLNSDVFQSLDPEQAGRDVDLKELLDAASQRVDARFGDAPLANASILQSLGNFYAILGEYDSALVHLQRALDLRRSELGDRHLAIAESQISLARALESMGRCDEAEDLLQSAHDMRMDFLGNGHTLTNESLAQLADFARRRGDLEREALLLAQLPKSHAGTTPSGGKALDGEAAATARLAAVRRELGENHPEVAAALVELADTLAAREAFDAAELHYVRALTMWARLFGPESGRARETFAKLEAMLAKAGGLERLMPSLSARLDRAVADGSNAQLLGSAAWDIVKRPGYPNALYARAVPAAETACRIDPSSGALANTLGVAQYRAGRFEDALVTLGRADGVNGGHPADIAFHTMVLARLGEHEKATRQLQRLELLAAQKPWVKDVQTQAFLGEARDSMEMAGPP